MNSTRINSTNDLRPLTLLWTQSDIDEHQTAFIACLIGSVVYLLFWIQLAFCSSLRHRSMQWIYAFLTADIFLFGQFFFIYIVHTVSTECEPKAAWIVFVSYFEATLDNYFNILKVYILLALNICRYIHIAYNRNVYTKDQRLLLVAHAAIYLLPLIGVILLFLVGWAVIVRLGDGTCDVFFTNIYVQILNVIIGFALPIGLNVFVIYASIRHVKSTSALRRTQHHATAREKYHRSLVIQFLVFYIIWIALWSPNIIVYQLTTGMLTLTRNVRLLNFIEIGLDPLIIAALDVRFWHVWRKAWLRVRDKWRNDVQQQKRRVRAVTTNRVVPEGDKNQETAL